MVEQALLGLEHEAPPAAVDQPTEREVTPQSSMLSSMPNRLDAGDRWVDVLAVLTSPRLVLLGNVLSEYECDALIEAAQPSLIQSRVVGNDPEQSELSDIRTSSGTFFNRKQSPLIATIEARVSRLVGLPEENGEGLQVLKYLAGAKYEPHQDYFDTELSSTPAQLRRGGQRIATMLMYLNNPTRGGGTIFPDANFEVAPRRGSAVIFTYAKADASSHALHGGSPVIEGEKWVATKWFRQGVFV